MHRHVAQFLFVTSVVLAAPAALAAGGDAPAPDRPAEAPAERPRSAGFGMGVALHRFQDDFGFGLVAGSPAFARILRVTLGGGMAFLPHVVEDGQESWVRTGTAARCWRSGASSVPCRSASTASAERRACS